MANWKHRVVDGSSVRRILWMIAAASLLLIVVAIVLIYQFTIGPNLRTQAGTTDGTLPATSPSETPEPPATQSADQSSPSEPQYIYHLYARNGDHWEPVRTITAASHADAFRDAAQSIGDDYRGNQIRLEQDPPPDTRPATAPTTAPAGNS